MTPTIRTGLVALALTAAFAILPAQQAGKPVSPRATDAELSLLGIRLMDQGIKVINKYGTPDEILGLGSGGGGGAAPSGTGSSAPGGSPGGRPGGGGGGGGAGAGSAEPLIYRPGDIIGDPFGQGNSAFRQFSPEGEDGGSPRGPSRSGAAGGGGGAAPSGPSAAGSGGGPAGGGGAAATGTGTIFTRWVYKKGTSQFSFVFDKFNRVVQIEAIGLNDYRVKTRKGSTFGWNFGQLIKTYGAPESYEVGGQNLVVKYLVKKRVAFRLSRLRPNEKHRVTGIVIAAGKD